VFLRSLTLRGFKSFADRTTLEFAPGISAVVGPNGSGKSNLVDAIAWVLGEQGPRALRGTQMADVIFAGSPGRSALGMAEVSLVIDNSAGLIPVDVSEIEVSRVVYRSGESQYLIGGKPVRLMDIQELLSDTGIGRALHTVVGQGQLEDVLTARPEDRRQFIEEAAGIAKHRKRKERAQRKLGGLEQDLLRLQDVMVELRRQLKPLKQQAESAEKHRTLSEQADELSWRIAAARLRDLTEMSASRRSGWEEGQTRRRKAEERLKALDADIAELGERLAATEQELRAAEDAGAAAIEARSSAEHALREAVKGEGESRARVAAESGRSGRLFSLEEEARSTEEALSQTAASLAEKETELAEAERTFQAAEQARRDAEEARRAARESAAAHRAESESLHRSLASAEAEHQRLTASLEGVSARLEEAVRARNEVRGESEGLKAGRERSAGGLAGHQEAVDGLLVQIRDLEGQGARLDARAEALAARRETAGATPGRRFLGRRKRAAIGLLGDLVRVKGGMERTVAAALGSLADAVVYQDHERAVAEAEGADGATLVVASVEASSREEAPLSGERRLLDAVDADPKVERLVATALRHVYLATDPSDALRRHRAHPQASFVTPEGILVGRRVVRTAAAPEREEEALRRADADLERERSRLRAQMADRRRELKQAESALAEQRGRLGEEERGLTAAAERVARAEAEAGAAERERDLVADRLSRVDEALRATRDALARLPQDAAELPPVPPAVEPPMSLRVEVEALRRDRSRLEAGLARARAELDRLRAEDPDTLRARAEEATRVRAEAETALEAAERAVAEATTRREEAAGAAAEARAAEVGTNEQWREAASLLQRLRDEYEEEDQARRDVERRIAEGRRVLSEGHGQDPDQAVAALSAEDTVDALQKRADLVARRLTLLGRVNLVAGEEFHALQERHDFLQREIEDVKKARRDLQQVVREVDRKIAEVYEAAFHDVSAEFERMFTTVFPGGEGHIVATEGEDLLSSGVEIEARPGRKRVKRLSLLSGGERALTALAFLFAIFKARPSPFYLLDEVEAALDDVNLHRFIELIRDFARDSQVLLVTHQKRTMEAADVLYGVSMGKESVSAVITQRVSEAVPATAEGA
jgi:chromosome segregation protein